MKPLHRYLASLAVAAALLTSARRGDAKEPTSAPASATALAAAAKAKAKQASVQYGLGNFSGALALYLEALKVLGHPALIFNVAQCYYALQRWQQAVFHYDHYLAEWSKHHGGQAAPNLAGVLRRIAKAKLAIKQQQMNKALSRPVIVRPTIVMKTPASNVARMQLSGIAQNGARVLIDGQLLGLTPVASAFELPPGKHRVRVEAAGCLPWQRDVMLQAGIGPSATPPLGTDLSNGVLLVVDNY